LLRTFDFPSPDATSPQRDATTVPQQALFLMNHPFVLDCARRLAQRPDVAGEKAVAKRIARMYEIAYARPPKPEELAVAREYLGDGNTAVLWERYAQALLAANEFAFVD